MICKHISLSLPSDSGHWTDKGLDTTINKTTVRSKQGREFTWRGIMERCGAKDAEEIREMGKQGQVCVEEYTN